MAGVGPPKAFAKSRLELQTVNAGERFDATFRFDQSHCLFNRSRSAAVALPSQALRSHCAYSIDNFDADPVRENDEVCVLRPLAALFEGEVLHLYLLIQLGSRQPGLVRHLSARAGAPGRTTDARLLSFACHAKWPLELADLRR